MFSEEQKNNNMQLNRIISSILFFAVLFIAACSSDPKPAGDQLDNYYFVKVGNVALPVRVCGNINSNIAIIFIHGGPGGSGQGERGNIYWKEIEKFYKVIYYDQRGSGVTQGNTSPEEMSIEQFSEDLDNIVDFTKQVAKANKVFIHGASWGGGLATYYLLDTAHQNKLKGAIIESPAYDIKNGASLSIQWLLQKADSMIALGKNIDYWNNCKQRYAANPVLTKDDFKQHLSYLTQVFGLVSNGLNVQVRDISTPKVELGLGFTNGEFAPATLTYEGQSIFTHLDLTSKLNQITLPVMLVWGDKDGLLPKNNLAQKFIDNIGTTDLTYDETKYLLSAHLPHFEEWQQFNIDTKIFVEAHK
jgi:pimeloyl-ACP methyl ester carboxylesterase